MAEHLTGGHAGRERQLRHFVDGWDRTPGRAPPRRPRAMIDPGVLRRLERLLQGQHSATADPLDAGAELGVTNSDGAQAFLTPLARHLRLDDDDPSLLWIRPVIGGAQTDAGTVFDAGLARRRCLAVTTAGPEDRGGVVLELATGQRARIGPAGGTTCGPAGLGRLDVRAPGRRRARAR